MQLLNRHTRASAKLETYFDTFDTETDVVEELEEFFADGRANKLRKETQNCGVVSFEDLDYFRRLARGLKARLKNSVSSYVGFVRQVFGGVACSLCDSEDHGQIWREQGGLRARIDANVCKAFFGFREFLLDAAEINSSVFQFVKAVLCQKELFDPSFENLSPQMLLKHRENNSRCLSEIEDRKLSVSCIESCRSMIDFRTWKDPYSLLQFAKLNSQVIKKYLGKDGGSSNEEHGGHGDHSSSPDFNEDIFNFQQTQLGYSTDVSVRFYSPIHRGDFDLSDIRIEVNFENGLNLMDNSFVLTNSSVLRLAIIATAALFFTF